MKGDGGCRTIASVMADILAFHTAGLKSISTQSSIHKRPLIDYRPVRGAVCLLLSVRQGWTPALVVTVNRKCTMGEFWSLVEMQSREFCSSRMFLNSLKWEKLRGEYWVGENVLQWIDWWWKVGFCHPPKKKFKKKKNKSVCVRLCRVFWKWEVWVFFKLSGPVE